jgi:hypothetical protein
MGDELRTNADVVMGVRQRIIDLKTKQARKELVSGWLSHAWKSGSRGRPPQYTTTYTCQVSPGVPCSVVCARVFTSLVRGFVSPAELRTFRKRAMAGHAPTVDRRGGAFNVLDPAIRANVVDFVSNQPLMTRHYSNTERFGTDTAKVILTPEATRAMLYDGYIRCTQPRVHAMGLHLQRRNRSDSDGPASAPLIPDCKDDATTPKMRRRDNHDIPAIGRRAFEDVLRSLNYRRGAYFVDRCGICTQLWVEIDKITPSQVKGNSPAAQALREKKRRLEGMSSTQYKKHSTQDPTPVCSLM